MALDQIDIVGVPAGVLVSAAHRSQLPLLGRSEQVPVHVVGKSDPGNHGQDFIAVFEGIGESFENEDRGPFADHESIGLRVEGRTAARGRERPQLSEAHLRVVRIGAVDPSGEHGIGPPGEEFVGRELDRVQR